MVDLPTGAIKIPSKGWDDQSSGLRGNLPASPRFAWTRKHRMGPNITVTNHVSETVLTRLSPTSYNLQQPSENVPNKTIGRVWELIIYQVLCFISPTLIAKLTGRPTNTPMSQLWWDIIHILYDSPSKHTNQRFSVNCQKTAAWSWTIFITPPHLPKAIPSSYHSSNPFAPQP